MAKEIQTQLRSIGEYLKNAPQKGFVVPVYQRRYTWDAKKECAKLWQDIKEYIATPGGDNRDTYFFGTIILDCSHEEKRKVLDIVDGQQRTITFILLFKALWMQLQKKVKDPMVGAEHKQTLQRRLDDIFDCFYKTDDMTRSKFQKNWKKVQSVSVLESDSMSEEDSHKNDIRVIVGAKEIAEVEESCYCNREQERTELKRTAYFNNFKFFYDNLEGLGAEEMLTFALTLLQYCQIVEIRSSIPAQAIMVFNSLNSKGTPLSDADIIAGTLFEKTEKQTDKNKVCKKWKEFVDAVGKLQTEGIRLDDVLRQYMYILQAKNGKKEVQTSIRKYFLEENLKSLKDNPLKFCNDVNDIAQRWLSCRDIPAVKILFQFNRNAKYFLASFLNRYNPDEIDRDAVVKVTESLLRLFSLLELSEKDYSSDEFKAFLLEKNVVWARQTTEVNLIEADIAGQVKDKWEYNASKTELANYNSERNKPFVYLNEYLYAKSKRKTFDFNADTDVEHILPDSGKHLPTIRRYTGLENQDEFEKYVNKLGNKILLESQINRAIGNEWFGTKQNPSLENNKGKKVNGYAESSFFLANALAKYRKEGPSAHVWEKYDIDKATEKAATRIADFIFGKPRAAKKRGKA